MNERINEAYIPIGFCPTCKEDMPIEIDVMINKKFKKKIQIGHCSGCEYVLNLSKDFKIRWITLEEIIKMGWKPVLE